MVWQSEICQMVLLRSSFLFYKTKTKTCVSLLQITKHFPVLLFSLPFHGIPKSPSWVTVFLSLLHHPPALPRVSCAGAFLGLSLRWWWFSEFPLKNSVLFICVSSLEISSLATTSKAIYKIGDKPQKYIFTPYFFYGVSNFCCIVGISACFSQTIHVENVPNATEPQNVFLPLCPIFCY